MNDTFDITTCWYRPESIQEMNAFYDKYRSDAELIKHLIVFSKLLESTDLKQVSLLDLGCGTAMLSEYCNDYAYHGADLPHVLAMSSMRNYPRYFYKSCELNTDDLTWIHQYPIVVMNAVLDVLEKPMEILGKVLDNCGEYLIIHRQEITETGQTHTILNGSYGGTTYHSIINRKELTSLLDAKNFQIALEMPLHFTNWENNGSSMLIRKRKSWALNNMDVKLYQKYFLGKENGVFIEAGANDGISQSNTMYFEFYKNWSGVLIEPIKPVFDKLKENRSTRNKYHNCALVSSKYHANHSNYIEIIYTKESSGLLSVINDSNAKEMMKRAVRDDGILMRTKARTLNDVLDGSLSDTHIDLMILDIEGYEMEALKGIDFSKWIIDYLLIEELKKTGEIQKLLSPYYEKVEAISENDNLYKKINQ